MLCEKCGNNIATVFSKQNEKEIYICSECYQERENKTKFGIKNMEFSPSKVCTCGVNFAEILESGYVGCEKCYVTFEEELKPIIKSLHLKTLHTGKVPLSKKQKLLIQIEKARKNNFVELANKLQKQLNLLEEDNVW